MQDLLQELDVYRRQILEGVSAEEIDRKQKELGVAFPEGMKVFSSLMLLCFDMRGIYK